MRQERFHPALAVLSLPEFAQRDLGSLAGEIRTEDIADLIRQARGQDTLFSVCSSLLKMVETGRLDLPPHSLEELKRNRTKSIHIDMEWEMVRDLVLDNLPPGVPAILLKGAALRTLIYKDAPQVRACHDLDILIPSEELEQVERSLLAAGFESGLKPMARTWHTRNLWYRGYRGIWLLELHTTLDSRERSVLGFHSLLPFCKPGPGLPAQVLVPDFHANVFVSAVHALKHGLDLPIKSLVDIHCLLLTGVAAAEMSPGMRELFLNTPGAVHTLEWMSRVSSRLFRTSPAEYLAPLPPSPHWWMEKVLDLATAVNRPGFSRLPSGRFQHIRLLWYQSLLTGEPATMLRVLGGYINRRLEH